MIRVSIEANDGVHLRHLLVGMLAGINAPSAQPAQGQARPENRDTASDDTSQMQSTGPLAPADTSSTAPSGGASASPAPSSEAEQPTPSEQRKRGRPAKVKAEPPAPTGEAPAPADAPLGGAPDVPPNASETPNPEATTPPKELDITDMRAALQAYAAKNGVPAAQALLEKHGGAKKISDLKPDAFAAFYAECKG